MKRFFLNLKLLMVMLLLPAVSLANAQSEGNLSVSFSSGNISIDSGEDQEIGIVVSNPSAIKFIGFQGDLVIPVGLELKSLSLGSALQESGFSLRPIVTNPVTGNVRLTLTDFSLVGSEITSGEIIKLTLVTTAGVNPANVTLSLRDILFTAEDGSDMNLTGSPATDVDIKVPASGISLDAKDLTIEIRESVYLTATVTPSNSSDTDIIWTSDAPGIASVDNGKVTGVSVGTANITATCGNVFATCKVTVKYPMPTSIAVSSESLALKEGETSNLTYTLTPSDAVTTVTWTSADSSVATVDNTGKVTAIKEGQTSITVTTAEGQTATCTVKVSKNIVIVSNITVTPSTAQVKVGETATLTATVTPDNATDKTVTWSTSDASVATVVNGVVTGVKVGSVTITATASNGKSASATVTVTPPSPTAISVSPTTLALKEGEDGQLTATLTPADAATTLTWTSSDPSIATVDNTGKVTALKEGQAEITVSTAEGQTATCSVTVSKDIIVVSNITVTPSTAQVQVGKTITLTATVSPENATDKSVTWSISDASVATVNNGVVTGVKAGVVTITATASNGKSASATVTITPPSPTAISVSPTTLALKEGEDGQLTATLTPSDASTTLTWTSSGPSIATVDNTGKVTALKEGQAEITVSTAEGQTATCSVTVSKDIIVVSNITVTPSTTQVKVGETVTLTATVTPDNATDKTVTWSTSDASVATVNNGVVTGVKAGVVTITATASNGKSASATVTVTPPSPTAISVSPTTLALKEGETGQLTATLTPADAATTLTWTSSNPAIATVDNIGKVIALKEGETLITIETDNGFSATVTVKVSNNIVDTTDIILSAEDIYLLAKTSYSLIAQIIPDNATNRQVTWRSNHEEIAEVNADGVVTGIKEGKAIITAICGTASANCQVTVFSPIEITVDPAEDTTQGNEDDSPADNTENGGAIIGNDVYVRIGQTASINLTLPDNLSTVPRLKWSLEAGGEKLVDLNVNENTLGASITGKQQGETAYNVSLWDNDDVIVNGKITVIAETPMTSLTVNPSAIDFMLGDQPIQLETQFTPENASNTSIVWISSNPDVATVSPEGMVTPIAEGECLITATANDGSGLSATCQVTVTSIPEITIEVSHSPDFITVNSGDNVTLWVNAAGGNPEGWSFLWTSEGQVIANENSISFIAVNDYDTALQTIYTVNITNEFNGLIVYSENFNFTVEVLPVIILPDEEDLDISGINVSDDSSLIKIREGNNLTLSVKEPTGGFVDNWDYLWRDNNQTIGTGRTVETTATMPAGSSKEIFENLYSVTLSNYSPEGELWAEKTIYLKPVNVYRRPQTPAQLLRKGNGSSCTFITMMDLNDSQISENGYNFVYGYIDPEGENHVLTSTPNRYCHITSSIYHNSANKFWVYATWTYEDGSVVSSGLRYLNGEADEKFDASDFSLQTKGLDATNTDNWIRNYNGSILINVESNDDVTVTVHTFSGRCVYSQSFEGSGVISKILNKENLVPDFYIVTVISGKNKVSKKVVIR
ncbi:MAG: Ig-like domain-containing protein [Muribaculaceae bacterium]|nr:Ig-like domain-containing protein [Muribaculaceae bacterium]